MNAAQQDKLVSVTPPAAIYDNTALTTASVDTKGWGYAKFVLYLGATDIAMTVLKLRESDDDSTYSDVTGAIYGTSNNIAGSTSALPTATDDNKFFTIEVDLRGRKRYLDLSATAGDGATGTYASVHCVLSRAADGPVTAAERGCGDILRV